MHIAHQQITTRPRQTLLGFFLHFLYFLLTTQRPGTFVTTFPLFFWSPLLCFFSSVNNNLENGNINHHEYSVRRVVLCIFFFFWVKKQARSNGWITTYFNPDRNFNPALTCFVYYLILTCSQTLLENKGGEG